MRPLALLASFLLLGPALQAQLRQTVGDLPFDLHGHSVDGLGDVDGDGIPDYAVGSPRTSLFACGGAKSRVEVFSGSDGGLLQRIELDVGEHHGCLVRGIGDADGDGRGDFLVANSPDFDCALDVAAYLYSGADGSLLVRVPTDEWWELYDFDGDKSLGRAGDVDGDGRADFLLGDADAVGGRGTVRLFSGATYQELLVVTGPSPAARLGRSTEGVGDWDGDGLADVAVGGDLGSSVHSPASGLTLFSTPWTGRLGDPGDHDGDGARDLLVGGRVVSGADGSVLLDLSGWSGVRVAGDLDGDGSADFSAVRPGDAGGPGRAVLLAGADGSLLVEVWRGAAAGEHPELDAVVVGDVDGDGRAEVLVGSPFGGPAAGASYLVSGWCPPAPQPYCVAAPNSAGPGALLRSAGAWSVSTNSLVLRAEGLPANHFGLLFFGAGAQQVPFGAGFLCVAPPLFRLWPALDTGPDGVLERPLDLASAPLDGLALPGSTWRFQVWYRDVPAGAPWFNLSDGLEVRFCP